MTLLIRGGTVVTAETSARADVLCEGGLIWKRRRGPRWWMPAGCW
jgi:dihydroorotase-like cyclic amidohydrolase